MRNNSLIPARPRENHPISPGTHTARIQIIIRQDGELVIGRCVHEGEVFVVVVAVGVVVGADGLAVPVVAVAFIEGGVDVGLGVAGAAAGFGALAGLREGGCVRGGGGLGGKGDGRRGRGGWKDLLGGWGLRGWGL